MPSFSVIFGWFLALAPGVVIVLFIFVSRKQIRLIRGLLADNRRLRAGLTAVLGAAIQRRQNGPDVFRKQMAKFLLVDQDGHQHDATAALHDDDDDPFVNLAGDISVVALNGGEVSFDVLDPRMN